MIVSLGGDVYKGVFMSIKNILCVILGVTVSNVVQCNDSNDHIYTVITPHHHLSSHAHVRVALPSALQRGVTNTHVGVLHHTTATAADYRHASNDHHMVMLPPSPSKKNKKKKVVVRNPNAACAIS